MSVDGKAPRDTGVDATGSPRIADWLGNKFTDTYSPMLSCGARLTNEQVEGAASTGYESEVEFDRDTKSKFKVALGASVDRQLATVDAQLKAAAKAELDRAVDETIKGKYSVHVQAYTIPLGIVRILDGGADDVRHH